MLGLSLVKQTTAEGKSGVKNLELSVVRSDVLDPVGPGQKGRREVKKRGAGEHVRGKKNGCLKSCTW